MRVDGREVTAAGTLLDACRTAGMDVPAFCHAPQPGVSVGGHCRSCVVEVDGRFAAACTTPAAGCAEVRTDTTALQGYRRQLGELMLTEAQPNGTVAEVLRRWGSHPVRDDARRVRARDHTHPVLRIDLGACILCRRCERACADVQGQFVLSVVGRGSRTELAWGADTFAESACVTCGACVDACPTGAITDRDREVRDHRSSIGEATRTTCGYCGVGCQLDVTTTGEGEGRRIARIAGAPGAAVNDGHTCAKGRYGHGFVRHPDRLRAPLVRVDGVLVETSWEAALARVAAGLRGRTVAGLSSARATNEENYVFQRWMRAGLGTNDVDCCARVCHAPSAAGMRAVLGTGAATNEQADVEQADVLVVVGANMTEAHPVLGARVRQAALRGARLIVVDPRRTELAALADVHLRLRPGSNLPLLGSLACALARDGCVDQAFLDARTEGWDAFRDSVWHQTPERWEPVSGVPAAQVRAAARLMGQARAPMFLHGLGVTEHVHGTDAVELLCALALLRGAIGRPGTGVNPLRGQNNVQGAVDMGADPAFLPGYQPVADEPARRRVEAVWGRRVPSLPGRTLPQMLDAMRAGRIEAGIILGEDVVRTEPDTRAVGAALGRLDFLCVIELFLSETASLADVVLPGASWLEKDGTFTNAERRVQRVRRVLPPAAGLTDLDVLLRLATATGNGHALRDVADVQREIARVAPGYAGLPRLPDDGAQWPLQPDGTGTPILHVERFATSSGRARLRPFAPDIPTPLTEPLAPDELLLTTGRRLHAYNAGGMTRRSGHALPPDGDALDLHPDDAARLGVQDGKPVVLDTAHGSTRARARLSADVGPGAAFLSFHAAATRTNALLGPDADRVTGCPAYKVARVRIGTASRSRRSFGAPSDRRSVVYCVPFDQLRLDDLPRVGGKNAALGELTQALAAPAHGALVRVPPGFAVTVDAYDDVLAQGDTRERLARLLSGLRPDDVADLARRASEARAVIRAAGLPAPVADAIRGALVDAFAPDEPLAVRSSATAEDLPEASFAGQQESYLNVVGPDAVLDAVLSCMASLFTARALAYRHANGIDPLGARLSVGVQRMVRADLGAAGVLFTLDPETGFRDVVVINGAWGLGESVVGGRVEPDEWVVSTPQLGRAAAPIVRRRLGGKASKVVAEGEGTRSLDTTPDEQARFCLDDDEVLALAAQGVAIVRAWGARAGSTDPSGARPSPGRDVPMDVEWAREGRTGQLWILQARPETVHARRAMLERWRLEGAGEVLLRGQAVGQRIGAGPVRVVRSVAQLPAVQPGDVVVAEMTDPDWVPVMRRAGAIVTDGGGRTCHAAIVSRELGVPCVVGTRDATRRLTEGQLVTVDGSGGAEGRVLAGRVPFRRETVDPGRLPRPRTRVLLNLADPDRAFALASLPVDGVGLARQEFIVAERIGVHPCAVLFPERVDAEARADIAKRARGHADPVEWYVRTLAEGLGTIAAAFHPRPVIARFSDFKTNEYARLVGGAAFEPREENPMIGWRGAARYTDPRFRAAFGLECRAVRWVRERMGLTNLEVMVPFCRTVEEARRVLEALAAEGLRRVPDGPRVHVMCEVPSNVAAIDLFAGLFDGFSIGSNDLTQLVLGVDRDSRELAGLFREDDPAVRRTISAAIRGAHAAGRPIGICGQAPSDDPAFAAFLVREGIDSLSLDPSSVLDILPVLAQAERVPEMA